MCLPFQSKGCNVSYRFRVCLVLCQQAISFFLFVFCFISPHLFLLLCRATVHLKSLSITTSHRRPPRYNTGVIFVVSLVSISFVCNFLFTPITQLESISLDIPVTLVTTTWSNSKGLKVKDDGCEKVPLSPL